MSNISLPVASQLDVSLLASGLFEIASPLKKPKVMAKFKLGEGTLDVWSDDSFIQNVCLELSDKIPLEKLPPPLAQDILTAAALELIKNTPLALVEITSDPPSLVPNCIHLKLKDSVFGKTIKLAISGTEEAALALRESNLFEPLPPYFGFELNALVNEGEARLGIQQLLSINIGDFVFYESFATPKVNVGGVYFNATQKPSGALILESLTAVSPQPVLELETARCRVSLSNLVAELPKSTNHSKPFLTLGGEPIFEGTIQHLANRKAFYICGVLPKNIKQILLENTPQNGLQN